jgi:hypothetical protein
MSLENGLSQKYFLSRSSQDSMSLRNHFTQKDAGLEANLQSLILMPNLILGTKEESIEYSTLI